MPPRLLRCARRACLSSVVCARSRALNPLNPARRRRAISNSSTGQSSVFRGTPWYRISARAVSGMSTVRFTRLRSPRSSLATEIKRRSFFVSMTTGDLSGVPPEIVAAINSFGGAAKGFAGTDIFRCRRIQMKGVDGKPADLGYVGEVTGVNTAPLLECIEQGITPVISPTALGNHLPGMVVTTKHGTAVVPATFPRRESKVGAHRA